MAVPSRDLGGRGTTPGSGLLTLAHRRCCFFRQHPTWRRRGGAGGGAQCAARIVTQARSVLGAQALSAANRRFPVPSSSFSSTRFPSGLVAAALRVRARPGSGGRLWEAAGVPVAEGTARNLSARARFGRAAGSAKLGAWGRGSESGPGPGWRTSFWERSLCALLAQAIPGDLRAWMVFLGKGEGS